VFAKREVAYEEKQTEQLLKNELFKLKCEFEAYSTSTLYQ
jgi:deoxyribodipyrimidine photo-lyase